MRDRISRGIAGCDSRLDPLVGEQEHFKLFTPSGVESKKELQDFFAVVVRAALEISLQKLGDLWW